MAQSELNAEMATKNAHSPLTFYSAHTSTWASLTHPLKQDWVLQLGPVHHERAGAARWCCVEGKGQAQQQLIILKHSLAPRPEAA